MSPDGENPNDEPAPEDFLSALRPGGDPRPEAGAGPQPGSGMEDLDPDLAIIESDRWQPPRLPPPVIDTRKYQFMIGGLGLALFLAVSAFLFIHGKSGTPGYAAGQRMHPFVAPLATSDLASVAANAHPFCNPARPSRRGLNVCNRKPIVLAFFNLGSPTSACVKQVDALQAVSRRYPQIEFAAVAINASKAGTAKLVRQEGWTIPIAYDLDDTIGEVYGVEVCPMVELATRNGVVERRLIGSYWDTPARLAPLVAKLAG
jgi:peroxiredoxin